MIIKSKLFFRKCERKKFNDAEYLQCTFLDENDLLYRFNFPVIKENEKYLSMHKDTLCDLELMLYPPIDKTKAKYCLFVI